MSTIQMSDGDDFFTLSINPGESYQLMIDMWKDWSCAF
jgi:hypothetical protein